MQKTLIHCALLSEAQAIIELLKLQRDTSVQDLPRGTRFFISEEYLLIVSGIGKDNTKNALEFIFKNYAIKKAINIGIAGCCDSSIKIGTLFCTNRLLPNINFAPITTVDEPLDSDERLQTLLVDMEAKYFKELASKYCGDIYIFKIVSDYLELEIPKKAFVIELVRNSLPLLRKYL